MRVHLFVTPPQIELIPPNATLAMRCAEEALACSALVGRWTVERLAEAFREEFVVHDITPPLRRQLEIALESVAEGFLAFCHGKERSLEGRRDSSSIQVQAVLDESNVHLLRGRWVYAFACRTGVELAGVAIAAGARCYAGYESAIVMEFRAEDLTTIPADVLDAWIELVTETPLLIARGVSDEIAIKRRINALSRPVIKWCDENPGRARGLQILAQQLVSRLVVRVAS